ncbi:MAG: chromosome segregation protein SMC [Desulfatiglandaceae bacterium]
MKIKKVSILGFKSFMERMDINFSEGISGVVGPNGCGKSNVVDAIRWCMGEQSPRLLRGRKMEDVIFNGANDQRPLGMAEVSLQFENGDGSFPSTFAQDPELSVTRRLYRSGESEYLINRVPCRLKDIQEVFMDTGLGNRAYSIIGQGQIGNILEQKPEETRVMLEEAAGITKYRKQVAASQRKIELTQANLQRVEDIMGEVGSRMRSLKRQAGKARRFKALSKEIQDLELIWYANTYQQLTRDSGNKLSATEALEQEELSRTTAISKLRAEIEAVNLKLQDKEEGLATCRQEYFRLKERVHKKEAGIESLSGEMKMVDELKSRLETEQEEIQQRLLELNRERDDLGVQKGSTQKKAQELEAEIALREERMRTRKGVLREIRESYESARSELNANENKETGLTQQSGYLNRMLEQITDGRSRLETELEEVKAKSEKLTQASERKNMAREATSDRLRDIQAAIEAENDSLAELEAQKEQMETDLKSAEGDLNRHHSRLSSLTALTENFEGYKIGVRTIMKASDFEPRNQGRILGILADIIRVDAQYERAVEAVLADKLQYVLVKSLDDGVQAVHYLKEKGKGLSSFAPIQDMKPVPDPPAPRSGLPALCDFVSVSEAHAPLIRTLLGDVYLTEDLAQAISLHKEIQAQSGTHGNGPTFVTKDGEMIDPRGVISGGRLSQNSRGLLFRRRELSELKKKVQESEGRVKGLQAQLQELTAVIEEKHRGLEGLKEDRWTAQDEINELDKVLFRLGQELDQSDRVDQKIQEDLERKEKERKSHEKELLELEEALQQQREKRKHEAAYFERKEAELKEAEAEFEEAREAVSEIRADHRIAEEEYRGLVREMERVEGYMDDSRERMEKIEEEIASGKDRHAECQRRKEILEEELKALYERLNTAESDMNQAELERRRFQDQTREEEGKEADLRAEVDALKDRINNARMEHSEIQFKMDNLAEAVKEKFNLNLMEVYPQHLQEDFSKPDMEKTIQEKKEIRDRMGEVNLTAIKEHEALKERHDFIVGQREDLLNSIESLRTAIRKINHTSLEKFRDIFKAVDEKLKEIFPILFSGGTAGLRLTDETKPLESGILVEVQPPGKRLSHMGLLSGGEKALVAMALLFAIYMIKPSPFCLLDEVDAPLDESNIERFNNLLQEIKRESQVIMVTHSRKTMEIMDRLYGITMESKGVSKLVSVNLREFREQISAN